MKFSTPQFIVRKLFFATFLCLVSYSLINAQESSTKSVKTWTQKSKLNSYKIFDIAPGTKPTFLDLDNDNHPDVMRYKTSNGFSVQWIDDDKDMRETDVCGDTDNDCLMVDINNDGKYGDYDDVVIDWVDTDNDGKADLQLYSKFAINSKDGLFMINIDLDKDNILNYIDYNDFRLYAWKHDGKADFFEDYSGQVTFLKTHYSPEKIGDLRMNWENPFLFFDVDKDGLSEYTIRLLDQSPKPKPEDNFIKKFTGKITYAAFSFDMDNDNSPANPLDFDMTINFRGKGFDYMHCMNKFKNLRGLPAADKFFLDPRIRQLEGFLYPNHEQAQKLICEKGEWSQVRFTYDEDDDCERWERVELYSPTDDPYLTGIRKISLDSNPQADLTGDRGEWDLDNSGHGNLYISPLDGKIHLFGAEKGYWRVDQNATFFIGMGGFYDVHGTLRFPDPDSVSFPLISYYDTDKNGFFDKIEYDLDGDTITDFSFSLKELGISDVANIYEISKMNYKDFHALEKKVSAQTWKSAQKFMELAEKNGFNSQWYSLLKNPKSIRQQYSHGYWLKFYLFFDWLDKARIENNPKLEKFVLDNYFSLN